MRLAMYILIFILLMIGITFSCLNAEPVTVNFYMTKTTMPLSILLVIAVAVGVLVTAICAGFLNLRLRIKLRHLSKRVRLAEQEVDNLRTIPLKSQH